MKVIVFLSAIALGGAVLQEIVLYESPYNDVGNIYTFRAGIPDIGVYPFAKDIVRFCQNTRLMFYSDVNYAGTVSQNLPGKTCKALAAESFKSVRFYGNPNTTDDGLSLFSETVLKGDEIYINGFAYGNIQTAVLSLGYTGKSAWTLFEGKNFDGKYICLPPPADTQDSSFVHNIERDLKIPAVGSVFKGCIDNLSPAMRRQLLQLAIIN